MTWTPKNIGYDLIIDEIDEESKVLDLGCGEGTLLYQLIQEKKIKGFGVEISQRGVTKCVEKGLFVYQGDIDAGLSDYKENSFDYVILNQTLQSTKKPSYVIEEMLRIGKYAIISFPNFAYYKIRMQLIFRGRMPKTKNLPYNWYESPNIHLATIKDFKKFCKNNNFKIKTELNFDQREDFSSRIIKFNSNFRAPYGFFVLEGK